MNAAGAHVHAPHLYLPRTSGNSLVGQLTFPRRFSKMPCFSPSPPHPPGGIRGTRAHLPVSLPRGGGAPPNQRVFFSHTTTCRRTVAPPTNGVCGF